MNYPALSESMVLGSGFTGWMGDMVSTIDSLVGSILGVVGVILAIIIIAKNPTTGRVIIGIIVGAFAVSLPWVIPAVGDMFRGDIESAGTGSPYALVIEEETPTSTLDS